MTGLGVKRNHYQADFVEGFVCEVLHGFGLLQSSLAYLGRVPVKGQVTNHNQGVATYAARMLMFRASAWLGR